MSRDSREQERKWRQFLGDVEDEVGGREHTGESSTKAAILELGVGLNTTGVLRWPNEDLVSESPGRAFRLVRVGLDAAGCLPWELGEQDVGIGISGDIRMVVDQLLS